MVKNIFSAVKIKHLDTSMAKGKNQNKTGKKNGSLKGKDEEEILLEKAVFGDMDGFESGLRDLDLETFLDTKDETDSEGDRTDETRDESEEEGEDVAGLEDSQLFFVDDDVHMSENNGDDSSDSESSEEEADDILDVNGGRAAWIDSDDERLEISLLSSNRLKKLRKTIDEDAVSGRDYVKRLRARFEKIYPIPLWAKEKSLDDNSEDDDEMDIDTEDEDAPISSDPLAKLLQSTSRYISTKQSKLLPPGNIDIDRLKDANHAARSVGAIQGMQFHPTHPLLLSAGFDQTIRLYHIDGKSNPLVTSLHFKKSPFTTALFHPDGQTVFAGGKRKHIQTWNIQDGSVTKMSNLGGHDQFQPSMEHFKISPCGRYVAIIGTEGWVSILSAKTGQWYAGAKAEGKVTNIAWFTEGKGLAILTTSGDVWEWDTQLKRFTGRWKDDGGIDATVIAIGGASNRWCAIGTGSGIVSVYDRQSLQGGLVSSSGEPVVYKPKAVLEQLVTPITTLEFSPDGQILVMASKNKPDALKLVHVPSFTVFKNWPTNATPLGRVTSVAFSPGGELLSIGNLAGKARLWKFNHFS